MRPGWNPTKRNRKIGTKAQGHGQDNRLVIPQSWHTPHCFWENLSSYVTVRRQIGNKEQLFFVEPPRNANWIYPCAIDDLCHLLSLSSPILKKAFDFIVLRQPTRKQDLLRSVWGRALYEFDLGKLSGSAVILEAKTIQPYTWSRSLDIEAAKELERLKNDGHEVVLGKRDITIRPSNQSLRNTVLYRTFCMK
ncbi:MAG: hypothetical protein HC765_07555 [Brachymonas sp.]|nr:hypothetical protein [Brachymonas sp.]